MRIFTDIASHDTTGVAGGRIARTDSSPDLGEETPVNGKWVFTVPEGAALEVDGDSKWFPQEDVDSISSETAAELLIRYPMYDHITYNFYLEDSDLDGFDLTGPAPAPLNTTPDLMFYTTLQAGAGGPARCQIGRGGGVAQAGMTPNSLALLPRSEKRAVPVFGWASTATVDLWNFNPFYVDVINNPLAGHEITIAGFKLTGVAGVPGVDEFQISPSNPVTATNIANAINDPANSFHTLVAAVVDPAVSTRVQLRPIPATNTTVTLDTSNQTRIAAVESHPGTDEVMMWWKVVRMKTTEDQTATEASADPNAPAVKSHVEISPEDPDLLVWASVDDGASWYLIPYLEPVDLVNAGTQLRVCFINLGTDKLYLQGFCVLFPDLPAPL